MQTYSVFLIKHNEITDRQKHELDALDSNCSIYHKYQTEYKIHCWIPPVTTRPPEDNSIKNDY